MWEGPNGSDKFSERSQTRNRLCESLAFQRCEVFLNRLGWIFEVLSLTLGRRTYDRGGEVQQVRDELVGVLGVDPICSQDVVRKVLQIESDDHVGS